MIDRESIFSDEEVVAMLKEKFVPLAVDQHLERRRRDEEGDFFRKVLEQAGRAPDGRAQGLYMFTASGKLLGFSNTLSGEAAKRLMRSSLAKFDPNEEIPEIDDKPQRDTRWSFDPPEGVTIVEVTSKVIGGFQLSGRRTGLRSITAEALGRDRMWITEDETKALAQGEVPRTVQVRIARFHLVDNTRGEPFFWGGADLREVEMKLEGENLVGKVRLETGRNDRGYAADVRGVVKFADGKLQTFDVVVLGDFRGRAAVTDRATADKYPLAVTFRVSDLKCEASRVAPGACRGGTGGYLNAT
ncbi:MAG: hypothetical protein WD066_13955 [Planctomycetaceae bacterium]